jgi:hypothetical protein
MGQRILISITSLFCLSAQAGELISENMISRGVSYTVKVTTELSNPDHPMDFCGSSDAEETTLTITRAGETQPAYQKLIASCLKTIDLKGSPRGGWTSETIKEGVQFRGNRIVLNWITNVVDGRNVTQGVVAPKGNKINYFEFQ